MKLTFLGTSGYHPCEKRHTSCVMLPDLGIILDAGSGFFRVREHISTPELHIFLSHAHLDHSLGLTFIFDVIHERPVKQVIVHGEAGKLEALQEHLFSPMLFPVKPPLVFRPFVGNRTQIGDAELIHFPLEHPGGSVGFRINHGGKSIGYVTDTTADAEAAYVEQIRDVDLLIHECYFPDGHESRAALIGHSCTSQVTAVANAAQAKRLMLVHINPLDESEDPIGIDVARKDFANVEIASDRQSIEV